MGNKISIRDVVILVLVAMYVVFLAWFLKLRLNNQTEGIENLLTNFYGLIPLIGGLYGLLVARHWGGRHSAVGRAVVFLSLGLITWATGIAIWLFYNFILHVEIPYPSWADAAFIISWPLWSIGVIFLSMATGAKFGLRKVGGKIMLFMIPLVVIILSYYFLVVVARGGEFELSTQFLQIFFDLAYPIGDIVILTLATLIYGLSFKYFGGKYRYAINLILAAFVLNYLADFTFSYTTTTETYYNGSLADILFATTMTVFSVGIALLDASALRRSGMSNQVSRTISG